MFNADVDRVGVKIFHVLYKTEISKKNLAAAPESQACECDVKRKLKDCDRTCDGISATRTCVKINTSC